jgi:tetratricopeptide (TPR) repeat protein
LFAVGNQAYEAGSYAEAVAAYKRIRSSGLGSPELHLNLGNAHYRRGELGKAILSYRRCLRLSPRDGDAKWNLQLARERAGSQPQTLSLVGRVVRSVVESFSSSELTGALVMLLWSSGAIGLYHVLKRSRWSAMALLALGLASVPILLLWAGRVAVEGEPLAVVIETAAGRSGPGGDYQLEFTAGEGTEVVVEKSQEGWALVTVPAGYRGWIEDDKLERW